MESLNYSLASCSYSSPVTTIHPFARTSVITASNQQTWPPSPAPPATRHPLQNILPSDFAPPSTDFVLYDTPAAQVSTRPVRLPSAPPSRPAFNAARLNFYSNSAPSSTSAFNHPQSARPPVPLFSEANNNLTGQLPQSLTMSGTLHPAASLREPLLTPFADHGSDNSFDLNMGAGLGPAYGGAEEAIDYTASAFTSVNNNNSATAGTPRTVSPRDIFQDPYGSAPPSTAFTNLTSPDINSPFVTDDATTSPLFSSDNVNAWYSLFPENLDSNGVPVTVSVVELTNPLPMQRTVSNNSFDRSSSSASPIIVEKILGRKGSVSDSPSGGVSKPRRRKGPLPPIAVDPQDKAAVKRARNTLAARDSRQRKFDHINKLESENSQLQGRITQLVADVEKWKAIALSLGFTEPA